MTETTEPWIEKGLFAYQVQILDIRIVHVRCFCNVVHLQPFLITPLIFCVKLWYTANSYCNGLEQLVWALPVHGSKKSVEAGIIEKDA